MEKVRNDLDYGIQGLVGVEHLCIWSSVDLRNHDCLIWEDSVVRRRIPRIVAV